MVCRKPRMCLKMVAWVGFVVKILVKSQTLRTQTLGPPPCRGLSLRSVLSTRNAGVVTLAEWSADKP